MTRDDRLLCYSCLNDDDNAVLDYWIPDEPDNFPCACELCGQRFVYA